MKYATLFYLITVATLAKVLHYFRLLILKGYYRNITVNIPTGMSWFQSLNCRDWKHFLLIMVLF